MMWKLTIALAVVISPLTGLGAKPGDVLWDMEMPVHADSEPAISRDGTIYTILDRIYAINRDGTIQWTKERYGRFVAVGPQGLIYLLQDEMRVLAPDGSIQWEFDLPMGEARSLAVGADGTAFLLSDAATFYAVDSEGNLRWQKALNIDTLGLHRGTTLIGQQGGVYVFVWDPVQTKLFRLNSTGKLLWERSVGQASNAGLSMDDFGRVYFASQDLFRTEGTQLSLLAGLPGTAVSGVSVAEDGALYVSQSDAVFAFEPGGELRWRYETEHNVQSQPLVDAEGNIYVTAGDRTSTAGFDGLIVLDDQGDLKTRISTDEELPSLSAPIMNAQGVVYFSATRGRIRGPPDLEPFTRFMAVQGFAPPAGPWPMARRTPQQTQRAF